MSNQTETLETADAKLLFGFPSRIDDAPAFVSPLPGGRVNVWDVTPTGVPAVDEVLGITFANELIAWARQHREPNIVSYIVAIIRERDRAGMLECGDIENAFFHRLAALAYCASCN